ALLARPKQCRMLRTRRTRTGQPVARGRVDCGCSNRVGSGGPACVSIVGGAVPGTVEFFAQDAYRLVLTGAAKKSAGPSTRHPHSTRTREGPPGFIDRRRRTLGGPQAEKAVHPRRARNPPTFWTQASVDWARAQT